MKTDHQTVLEIAQSVLQNDEAEVGISREAISEAVDRTLSLNRNWAETVDRDTVVRELETRFSIWIGRERVLEGDGESHEPWLNEARKEGWRYWPRYRQFMEGRLPVASVDSLNSVTDRIVGLLEDPNRPGPWDRRGLVVGHVQSGKTANYTGVICKAADAGYKVVVVLAGMHNNLRSQTQMRLDEGFLGYETMPPKTAGDRNLRTIGVGLIDSDLAIRPDYITNRANDGDFRKTVADTMGITPGSRPWLFVVKKNASVLKNLLSWVEDRVADTRDGETNRPIVSSLPLLVIDDEADNASVDTGDQPRDADGNPDPDYEPKAINRAIRRLLYVFEKSAYVGYTATPFANIFIHDQGTTAEYGDDLFPRSFIVNLPTPSDYAGPVRVFGLQGSDVDEENEFAWRPLPLVRHVTDHADTDSPAERNGWVPPAHRNNHRPLYLGVAEPPPSLRKAVLSFVLACAARRARKQEREHNSMLIHVTRYTIVQSEVKRQVEEYLEGIKRRLRYGEGDGQHGLMGELETLWGEDFVPTTVAVRTETDDPLLTLINWSEIKAQLPTAAGDISVREINGTAGDVLDYENHRNLGLNVIAIGGDKLARGLTLEGLTVSYFLRATRMYDTLMQMGRWFGYRPGYLDLCRLYTTSDLEEWFQHIAEASEELRAEFDHMVAVGGTPHDYGLKVKSHPVLMVTSRVKMRNSYELQLAFAGSVQETVVFDRRADALARNSAAADRLVRSLGPPTEPAPHRARPEGALHRWDGGLLWSRVSPELVTEFLREFRTHRDAVKVNAGILAEYIERQVKIGELTEWTIALLAGKEPEQILMGDQSVNLVKRKPNTRAYSLDEQKANGTYRIGRILAPRDEAIDLDCDAYEAALDLTIREYTDDPQRSRRKAAPTEPSGPSIRSVRGFGDPGRGVTPHPERGLLLLYPLSPKYGEIDYDGTVVGFGLSFPGSRRAQTVTYSVNNVYWNQEIGAEI